MLDWFNVWERLAVALPLVVVTCATVALMCRAEEHARLARARTEFFYMDICKTIQKIKIQNHACIVQYVYTIWKIEIEI